jgi:hypothetical protein
MLLGIDTFWLALPPEQHHLSHVRPEYYPRRSEAGPDGLEVDTTNTPPNILAEQLVDWMGRSPTPSAFATLRQRFESEP